MVPLCITQHIHIHTHTLSLSLSHTHALCLYRSHILSLFLSHTHTHTHTHTLFENFHLRRGASCRHTASGFVLIIFGFAKIHHLQTVLLPSSPHAQATQHVGVRRAQPFALRIYTPGGWKGDSECARANMFVCACECLCAYACVREYAGIHVYAWACAYGIVFTPSAARKCTPAHLAEAHQVAVAMQA